MPNTYDTVYRPAPPFIINLFDLSTRIKEDLADLDDETMDYVLKESICRIFEGVDQRYFKLSVRRIAYNLTTVCGETRGIEQ